MNTQQLAEQFHRDGFIVVKKVFSADEIARIDREIASYIAEFAATLDPGDIFYEPNGKAIKSMFRLDKRRAFFDALRHDNRVLDLVRAIFPGETIEPQYVIYFGKPAGDGTPAPPHQDNGFNMWSPPLALNVSIAVDPHRLENGAMHCNRGSHTLGVQPHKPSGVPGFSQTIAAPVDEKQFPPVPCLMDAGDLMVHHIDTVHFSGGNRSTQSRRMLTTTYWSPRIKRDEAKYAAIQAERLRLHGHLPNEK